MRVKISPLVNRVSGESKMASRKKYTVFGESKIASRKSTESKMASRKSTESLVRARWPREKSTVLGESKMASRKKYKKVQSIWCEQDGRLEKKVQS